MALSDLGLTLLRTRGFARAPIGLFRARLGFVFGGRVLLLEHQGRKSGQPRYVALEAVARPDPHTVILASGFGPGSQWYRNLRANPRCRVSIGFRNRIPATARMMAAAETKAVLAQYRRQHPAAYRELGSIVKEATGQGIEGLPLVELTLEN